MKLIGIVAASENNVIGVDNKMPWHLPEDLKFFKNTTLGHPVIMGKNTWLSLGGRALPGRKNIIISSSIEAAPEGVCVYPKLEAAIAALEPEQQQAFIIGGGRLYAATMDLLDELYITRVHAYIPNGQVFFPEFNQEHWECKELFKHEQDARHPYAFTVQHWLRNK